MAETKAETQKKRRERGATAQKREDELEKRRSKLTSDLSKEAILQILAKDYYLPYGGRGETVVLVGIGICGRGHCRVRLEDPPPLNPAS